LEGRELSGSWSIRDAAVFGEASVSSGLAKPAFGLTAARCSGPRAGDRPGPRGFLRELFADQVVRQPRFGDGRPLRGRPVRHRKTGCPADPGFRRGGVGRTSTTTFPAEAASLPPRRGVGRSGTAQVPQGPCAKVLTGRGRYPQGCRPRPGKPPRKRLLAGDLEKTGGKPRAALRSDGILRDPACAPGRAHTASRRLASCEDAWDRMSERRSKGWQARLGEFAPLGEISDLAALYRSRQARYPRAKAEKNPPPLQSR